MHEIDLIPPEHVRQRRLRRLLRRASFALAALALASGAARVALALAIERERPRAEQARRAAADAVAQRARLADLTARRADLDARLVALRQLRAGTPWHETLQRIDAAFGPGLWLDHLALHGQRGLEVKGHALDHATLTAFTRALSTQPGFGAVRLVDTGLRRYSTTEVVDFTVSARIDAPAQP
jgi:Tfp pilus assembly protein PilN